jgi:hypothetical protein
MRYKFLGKPDKIFPHLKTGKVYDLEIKEINNGFFGWLIRDTKPLIVSPIRCPYSSWKTFYQNWELT